MSKGPLFIREYGPNQALLPEQNLVIVGIQTSFLGASYIDQRDIGEVEMFPKRNGLVKQRARDLPSIRVICRSHVHVTGGRRRLSFGKRGQSLA